MLQVPVHHRAAGPDSLTHKAGLVRCCAVLNPAWPGLAG
jgi:hypothetical protein